MMPPEMVPPVVEASKNLLYAPLTVLGVKGEPALLAAAYGRLREGLEQAGAKLGPALVR